MASEVIYKRWGLEIHKTRPDPPPVEPYRFPAGYNYVRPQAAYSPWLVNQEFRRVYLAIIGNTMVDDNLNGHAVIIKNSQK
jgi:hypothetical protein